MIKTVKGLKIGHHFDYDGYCYEATKFPTRYSVCGKAVFPVSGEPSSCKVPLSQVNY